MMWWLAAYAILGFMFWIAVLGVYKRDNGHLPLAAVALLFVASIIWPVAALYSFSSNIIDAIANGRRR